MKAVPTIEMRNLIAGGIVPFALVAPTWRWMTSAGWWPFDYWCGLGDGGKMSTRLVDDISRRATVVDERLPWDVHWTC